VDGSGDMPAIVEASATSTAETAEPGLVAAREGGWPFGAAFASIMSRFGAWQ